MASAFVLGYKILFYLAPLQKSVQISKAPYSPIAVTASPHARGVRLVLALWVGLSQANARPGVVVKQVSNSPYTSWLSLAESDRPVAMLFLELNAESSPTTAAILHATTSGKITSDL